MNEHDERAYDYRQKAAELRAMLVDMNDPVVRATLEKTAAGYDQLANIQANLAKADKTLGRS